MAGTATKLVAIGLLLSTAGCASIRQAFGDRQGYYTRNLPDLEDNDVAEFAERQNNIWNCLVSLAQAQAAPYTVTEGRLYRCRVGDAAPNALKSKAAGATNGQAAVPQADTEAARGLGLQLNNQLADGSLTPIPAYSEVVAAGIHYVDVRCDRFMDALFWFNRMRETTSRQIQFVGGASAAALTILEASKELIGLTPLGIGLLDQTTNNIGRGLLYDLPPHTVRTLVEKQQQAYLAAVAKEYTSRPHALRTIQGYASLCLPATIEAEVNRAIAAKEFKAVPWQDPEKPAQAANSTPDATNGNGATPEEGEAGQGTPPPNHVPALRQDDD